MFGFPAKKRATSLPKPLSRPEVSTHDEGKPLQTIKPYPRKFLGAIGVFTQIGSALTA
jgi:hypothetical protein